MTKNPTTGNKNMLVGEALSIMNSKKNRDYNYFFFIASKIRAPYVDFYVSQYRMCERVW